MSTSASKPPGDAHIITSSLNEYLIIALAITIVTYFVYKIFFGYKDEWSKYGIKHPNYRQSSILDFRKVFEELLTMYGDTLGLAKNVLVTRDLDLLKHIMVKDFNNFVDRGQNLITNSPLGSSVFFAKGHQWRRLRNITTPSFTSGKLKLISKTVEESAEKLSEFLLTCARSKQLIPVKKTTSQYTSEIIARTAFGLKTVAIGKEDDEFTRLSAGIVRSTGKFIAYTKFILAFIPGSLKFLVNTLKIDALDVVSKDSNDYFTSLLTRTIPDRRVLEKSVTRKPVDFLQLIVAAQEAAGGSELENSITDDEIIGQSMLIIFAGFETTASTLMMSFYLLARHPDVQEKMCKEIDSVMKGGSPTKEELGELKYTEQVINETLRLYPPAPLIGRRAKETKTYGDKTIPAGTQVHIPIYNILRDPNHWPDPNTFNPDRFTEEAEQGRDPMAFMPFGYGPRLCIGMRLAYLEMKMALAHILRKVTFELNERTEPKRGQDVVISHKGLLTPTKTITISCVERS